MRRKLCGFLVELMEAGDLPSHPPVIKVFNVVLQVHKIAAGPNEEGAEPSGERLNGVFFAMSDHVSLCIQVDNVRGLGRALALVITGDPAIFQPLNPFGRAEDPIANGNVEVGHPSIILGVAIGGSVECILVVLNMVVEPPDLLFEMADFAGFFGFTLCNG